jgi:AsmA family protein
MRNGRLAHRQKDDRAEHKGKDLADAGHHAVTTMRDWLRKAGILVADAGRAFWRDLRALPRAAQWIIAAVAILIIAVILFLANPNWNWARGLVSSIASSKLNRPVAIDGNLRVHLFRWAPDATIENLRIGHPAWGPKQNVATAKRVAVKAEFLPILTGKIVLPRLQIDQPNVFLYQDAQGRANWDFSNGKDKGKATKLPLIKNFIITDGKVELTSLQRKMKFKGTINAHEQATGSRQAFGLTGNGSLNGKVFELNATGGPLLNIRTSRPYPFDMTVRAGATKLTAKGRVIRPFDLGHVEGAVTVSGRNLADLYYLTGLTLPNTPSYNVAANVRRDDRLYKVSGIKGRIGSSDINGVMSVKIDDEDRPYVTADLNSRALDFKDLGAVFGATDANAPQGAELSANPTPTVGRRLLPDAPLDVARIRGMDAKVRYRALSVKAVPNMPLREVSIGATLNKGLLTLDPIDFAFPQGRLQGTAKIDARGATQTNDIDLRLTGVRVQDFVPQIGGGEPLEGILNARVIAKGAGNSVHKAASTANGELIAVIPAGRIRQSLAELMGVNASKGLFMYLSKDKKETDVRCAVAHFDVRNGVLQARQIVFDTGVVLVNGKGTINLKDESMKFVLKGKPKKFRLIRINAPIVIGGHLTQPKVGIDAGPAIVQGGLTLALQSVVPLLPLDYAKDSNCGSLLAGAKAEGASISTRPPAKKANPAPAQPNG